MASGRHRQANVMTKNVDLQAPEKNPVALREAEHADLVSFAVSDAAKEAVEILYGQHIEWELVNKLRKNKVKDSAAEGMKSTVAALLGDLLAAALNTASEGYCYRGSARGEFKYTLAESRAFEGIKKSWKALGLLDVIVGFRGNDTWMPGENYYPDTPFSRWHSRLRATPKLLAFLAKHEITPLTAGQHFRRDLKLSQPVVLKAAKKGPLAGARISFDRNNVIVRQMEAEVNEINAFLAGHVFNFGPAPYLYRLFNNGDDPSFDWNLGGRFYASKTSYLNSPNEQRRQITIDGDPVVEIDITACQLTLLHAVMGEDLDRSGDPFDIEGLGRDTAKLTFNVMVGLGRAFDHDADRPVSEKRARERCLLLSRYPFLERIEAEGWNSLKLQAMDAEIMKDTLLTLFRDHGIPALPVHDCVIVRVQNADLAQGVFSEVFERKSGVAPMFSRKGPTFEAV